MTLINWIDKKLDDIKKTEEFKEFFSGIEITTIDVNKYLFNPRKGIDIVMSEMMIVSSIHLFSGNTSKSESFNGESINNVNFNMKRVDVEKILGQPNRSGGGYKDIFGDVPLWDKYYFDTYSLHLQYSLETGCIDIITLGSLQLEPYLNSALQ
jgi:hypothetical protein